MKLFIVIPCYNEENMLADTLGQINDLDLNKKIIVVDDGSFDRSYSIVKENFKNIILLRHSINLGKGAALKTGSEAAIKLGADTIAFIDADGQHPPKTLPFLAEKLEKEKLDVVFGARKINARDMPVLFYLGNKILTKIISIIAGVNLLDSQTGLKIFKASAYNKLCWQSSDYSVETEMIVNLGKNRLKYGQVFIETIYKNIYKGTTPLNGIKIFFNLLKQKIL